MYVLGKMCFKIVKERGGIKELMINRRKVKGKLNEYTVHIQVKNTKQGRSTKKQRKILRSTEDKNKDIFRKKQRKIEKDAERERKKKYRKTIKYIFQADREMQKKIVKY